MLSPYPVVIASEAKQSRSRKKKLDCFVARAPRNDEINRIARGHVKAPSDIE
jgi:hypothetical protein